MNERIDRQCFKRSRKLSGYFEIITNSVFIEELVDFDGGSLYIPRAHKSD